MKNGIDKAKLTAFAHGELKGKEAEEVAALLARDPAAQAYVVEVQALARRAQEELARDPLPEGVGADAIRRRIAARGKPAPSPSRAIWLQAGAIVLVAVTVLTVVKLKPSFRGGMAGLFGQLDRAERVSDDEPAGPRTQPVAKEDPRAVERDFDALGERRGTRVTAGHCRFTMPEPRGGDTVETAAEGVTARYLLAESGSQLELRVTQQLQPLVREAGMEETSRERGTLLRRARGAFALEVFFVPEKTALPFCLARLALDGKFPDAAAKLAGEQLEAFARRVAESLEAQ